MGDGSERALDRIILSCAMEDLMSQAEFARRTHVTRACVNRWLARRLIDGEAIVRDGSRIRIRPELARQQLRRRIDTGQRVGNGLRTRLNGNGAPAGSADVVDDLVRSAKLEALQRANRMAAAEEAARQGRFVAAADARQQMGRIAGQLVSETDGLLHELAIVLAARFGLPLRDVAFEVRQSAMRIRARRGKAMRTEAAAMAELREAEVEEVDP